MSAPPPSIFEWSDSERDARLIQACPLPTDFVPALRQLSPTNVLRPQRQLASVVSMLPLGPEARVECVVHPTNLDHHWLLRYPSWTQRVMTALLPEWSFWDVRWRQTMDAGPAPAPDPTTAVPTHRIFLPSMDLLELMEALPVGEDRAQMSGYCDTAAERELLRVLLQSMGFLVVLWETPGPREQVLAWTAIPTEATPPSEPDPLITLTLQQLGPNGYEDGLLEAATVTADGAWVRLRYDVSLHLPTGRLYESMASSEAHAYFPANPLPIVVDETRLQLRPAPTAPLVQRLAWALPILDLLESVE